MKRYPQCLHELRLEDGCWITLMRLAHFSAPGGNDRPRRYIVIRSPSLTSELNHLRLGKTMLPRYFLPDDQAARSANQSPVHQKSPSIHMMNSDWRHL